MKFGWIFKIFVLISLTAISFGCNSQTEEAAPLPEQEVDTIAEFTPTSESRSDHAEPIKHSPTDEPTHTPEPEPVIEFYEPATVMAAAKILDLSELPLIEGAEWSYQSVTSVYFDIPATVTETVDFYRTELDKMGWQEHTNFARVTDTTAALLFSKDNFTFSMLISGTTETTSGQAFYHGNLNLSSLPQVEDANNVNVHPAALSYASQQSLEEVITFTKQALDAQGWHEYVPPSTTLTENTSRQQLNFIQNGMNLLVSLSHTDGETQVHYTPSMVSRDIPIYPNNRDLIFDSDAPYVTYYSTETVKTILSFYLEEMTKLGWRSVNENITNPEYIARTFSHEQEQLALLFEVGTAKNDQVAVTLTSIDFAVEHSEDVDILTALLPSDAYDISLIDGSYELSYTTPADAVALANFYSEALPTIGWQVDAADPDMNTFFFSRDNEQILVNFSGMTAMAETLNVTVNYGLAPSLHEAIRPEDIPVPTAQNIESDESVVVNDDTPDVTPSLSAADLPLPENSSTADINASLQQISLTVPADVETLTEFYHEAMGQAGWQLNETLAVNGENLAILPFKLGEAAVTITILNIGLEDTEVSLDASGLIWDTDSTSEAVDTQQASSIPTEEGYTVDDWPIPDEATNISRVGNELSFTVPWDMQTAADFYRPTYQVMNLNADFCLTDVAEFSTYACSTNYNMLSANIQIDGREGESDVKFIISNAGLEDDATLDEINPQIDSGTE